MLKWNKHFLSIGIILLFFSCNSRKEPSLLVTPATINGTVHSIKLERMEPYFIEHEGRDLFIQNCTPCHSSRYIYLQPDFPRKTWQAEVTKMIEKFGAQIDSSNINKLVDYLAMIKGK
jgi:hypothetical protein